MRFVGAFSILLLVCASAAPADAQIVGRPDYGDVARRDHFLESSRFTHPRLGDDLRDVRKDIRRAERSGAISEREARRMRRELRDIGQFAYFYGHDGLTASEAAAVRARTEALRSLVNRPVRPTSATANRGR